MTPASHADQLALNGHRRPFSTGLPRDMLAVMVAGLRPATVTWLQSKPVAPPCAQAGCRKPGSGPMPSIRKPAKLATGVTWRGSKLITA